MFPDGFIVREVEVMELGAVVIADEAGELLEMLRLKLDDGRRAVAMGLLTTRDQRLTEEAAKRLPTEEAEKSWAGREAEDLVRPRRAEPLEVDWQLGRVEIFTHERRRKLMHRQSWRWRLESGNTFPIESAKPIILVPNHFLNRRLAAECATAAIPQ